MSANDIFGHHNVRKIFQIFRDNWDKLVIDHPTVQENDKLFKQAFVVHSQMHDFENFLNEIIEEKFLDEK